MRRTWFLEVALSLAVLLGAVSPAFGQGQPAGEPAPAAQEASAESHVAPVVIDGRVLFQVRGISAFPADRRAREIAARIEALASDRSAASSPLQNEERAMGTAILSGQQQIMVVLDEDARLEGIDRQILVQMFTARIAEAIENYRRDRDPARLARHALYALGATLALLLAAYVGRRVVGWLRALLERRYQARVQAIQDRAFQLVKVEQFWGALASLLNFAWVVGVLVMVYVYLRYILSLFPRTRALGDTLLALVIDPLQTMGMALVDSIPGLIFLVVLVLVTRYLLKLIRLFFDGLAQGRLTLQNFDPDWAGPTYRLVRMLVIAFAVVVAYPYVPGSSSDAFKGVSLFIGVIFSLGSSTLIGNVIAGYSMTYRRAFRLGDRVKIGQYLGDVERTRLLVTHLRTPKNEEVVVPNSSILGAEVVNFSSLARERGLILHTTVGIGYETPWRQVEAMLLEAAERTPGLLQSPAPFVLQTALGDFCVTYEINVYCDTPQRMAPLYTALHQNVLDVFNEYGIQIMTPAYEGDPEQPKVVPKDQWYAAPARRAP